MNPMEKVSKAYSSSFVAMDPLKTYCNYFFPKQLDLFLLLSQYKQMHPQLHTNACKHTHLLIPPTEDDFVLAKLRQ